MASKKIKDFLINDIFASAGFEANEIEFINAASDLSEVEISDELVKKYHDNMLSREAAKNNTELEKMFRSNHWADFASILDKRIEVDISQLEDTQRTTVKEIKNTPDKIGKLLEFMRANKPKTEDSEIEKKYNELLSKHSGQQTTYEGEISNLRDAHQKELEDKDNKFTDYKIDNLIKAEINNIQLIDNIPGGKNYLAESNTNTIRNDPRFIVGLENSGLVFNDRKDPSKKYFEDNKEFVLKKVLDPLMKDWRKNSPGPSTEKTKIGQEAVAPRALTFQQIQAEKARVNLEEAAANLG